MYVEIFISAGVGAFREKRLHQFLRQIWLIFSSNVRARTSNASGTNKFNIIVYGAGSMFIMDGQMDRKALND